MFDLLESNWTNPFSSYQPLLSISTGAIVSPEIERDLSVPSRGVRLPTVQNGTPRARETTSESPSYTDKAKVKDVQ